MEGIMTSSSVTIRVDKETKEGAARVAEHFGFDLSSVTRAFYKQMIRENRIPLNLSDPEPNAESLESIHDADAIIAEGGPGYGSAEEMFRAMGL
jgi:DNA-damage-inducible protein J